MASYNKIIDYIDNMILYDREYDVVKTLIDNADPRFFTKVLEEVVDGNMYWIDFYPILDTPRFREMLSDTMETQAKLYDEIRKMSEFRENITTLSYKNNLGISRSDRSYEELSKAYHDERLYNLLQYTQTDNIMTIACKSALFNAIENFKTVENSDTIRPNAFGELLQVKTDGDYKLYKDSDGKTYYEKDGTYYDSDGNEIGDDIIKGLTEDIEFFDYINPDDIIVSADDIIIPIDSRYQVLDDADRSFMMENNMNEFEMKQFKALRTFIARNVNIGGEL